MKISSYLFMFYLLLSAGKLSAQHQGGQGQGQGRAQLTEMKPGVVGKVIDGTSQSPVPFASVALYSLPDSSLAAGTISSEDGRFYIEAKNGNYYLVVNFMGFDKYTYSNGITISAENKMARVGMIKLQRSNAELSGVEIVGEQTYVEYKIDRKIVNVGRDIGATGGSAVNALENVPSVSVDIEGNVSLRGSGNFTVLINGKPSPLSGSEALEQIPTSMIKNIEIITNPSAKYDPDGTTGIINVNLKEDVKQGPNGYVEASAGSFDSYGFNGVFNYRKDKVNYFVGADVRMRNNPGIGESELVNFASDTLMLRDTDIDRNRSRNNYTFKGGVDYYANDKNTITVQGAAGINDFGKDYQSQIYERDFPQSYELFSLSGNDGGRNSSFFNTSVNWEHKFKKEGEKLDVFAYYSQEDEEKDEDQKEVFSNANWDDDGMVKDWYKTTDDEQNFDFRFKLDYTKKLKGDNKYELGLQSRNYRENSQFVFNGYDSLSNSFVIKPNFGNETAFNRDIYAGYATYSGTKKKFGYQLGLRGEYTYRVIENDGSAPDSKINRFDLFPTLHLSQKIKETNSILLSYSRRIDRPGGHELSPNPIYISSNFIRIGNPALEPEYTDNYELSYQKVIGKSFVSLEAYYRTTQNKIARLQEMDENFITYMTYDNLDRDHSAGFELMANMQLKKWMRVNLSGSMYYYKLEGNISSGTVDQSSNNYNLRLDVNFMITSSLRWQINGFYNAPSVTAQGKMQEFYMVNSALRYDLFNHKMSVTFNVRDIFNTSQHSFETITNSFTNKNRFTRQGPNFNLTVSYKINNYKQERRPGIDDNEGGGDDI